MSVDKHAIGIHIISRNKAGTFPRILASLSGLKFKEGEKKDFYPSFHYSRYQNCTFGKQKEQKRDLNYFYFTADITLEDVVLEDSKEAEKGAVILSLPDTSSSERNHIINTINKLLFDPTEYDKLGCIIGLNGNIIYINNEKIQPAQDENIKELLSEHCLFQTTTSPETYRAKLFNLLKNRDFFRSFVGNKGDKVNLEFDRAYVNTGFKYTCENNDKNKISGKPLAKLYLCCRHGNKPGALAAAINTLLFRKFTGYRSDNLDYMFNIMFLIDYFSFSPSVVYKDIYGCIDSKEKRIKIENKDDNNEKKNVGKTDVTRARKVIERILICPISDEHSQSKWSEYANNLTNFLNSNTTNNPGSYTIIKDPNDNDTKCSPKSILIYRNDKSPCWLRDKDHRDEDTEGMSAPDAGCDICRKCWWIDEFRKICYSNTVRDHSVEVTH